MCDLLRKLRDVNHARFGRLLGSLSLMPCLLMVLTEMYDEVFDYDTLTNRWSILLKNRVGREVVISGRDALPVRNSASAFRSLS